MSLRARIRSFWRNLFRRRQVEAELDAEVRAYLGQLTEEKIAAGMAPAEARRAALLELEGLEQVKERVREARMGNVLEQLWQDLRYGVRLLRKSPGFTAVAVLTLALGIGGISAIFTVVKIVLLDPLPYADSDRLVLVWNELRARGVMRAPGAGFPLRQLAERGSSFEAVGGIWASNGTFLGQGEPEQVKVGNVTGDFLPLLGTAPLLGRTLLPEDQGPGKPPVIVLSHGLWQRRFGADPAILGQPVEMEGASPVVVGVMPPHFRMAFPPDAQVPAEIEAWRPFGGNVYAARGPYYLRYVARLKPGVSMAQANEDAAAIGAQLRSEFNEYAAAQLGFNVVPMQADATREIRPALLALFAGVALVLLIACVNVANLLLARAGAREKEIALRATLGASRGRILRQLLSESAALAALGGAAGLLAGWWGLHWLAALAPQGLLPPGPVGFDARILGFTAAVALGCGVLFGLVPAWHASKTNLAGALRGAGRGVFKALPRRARAALIAGEVALGFVLLIGAGLLIRTFVEVARVNPGFRAEGLLTLEMDLPGSRYPSEEKHVALVRAVEGALRGLPGVRSVGGVSHLPLDDYPNWYGPVSPEGAPQQEAAVMADHRAATPDYFRTMGAELLAGRLFDGHDEEAGRAVVVVDERVAGDVWPGESAVGRRLKFSRITPGDFGTATGEVVGVIRHIQHHALTRQVRGQVYVPFSQNVRWHISFVVRTAGDPAALAGAVRNEVAKIDKQLAISKLRPMTFYLHRAMAAARFTMVLAALFGGLALLLAAVGLYGVIAYSVGQRTPEIGIRMALGAQRADILRQVIGEGMRLAAAGVALGAAGAFALAHLLKSLLFGVGPLDPVTFALTALVLPLTALAACWIPARRAARVDPMIALRHE